MNSHTGEGHFGPAGTTTDRVVDVLVAGTGAAGLTAAVTARKAGLDVLVVEKDDLIGGTTAVSGGVLWIPGSHHSAGVQAATHKVDCRARARAYLIDELGAYFDAERIDTYLDRGPEMVEFLERETEVKFYGMDYPDYRSESPNSSVVRSIGTVDYSIEALGDSITKLRNQLPQTLFMGLAVGSGVEMKQFMRAGRSPRAMAFVARRMLRHLVDVVRFGEGQQLVRGRALAARLTKTLLDLDTPIWLSSPVRSLIVEDGRVCGAVIDGAREIRVRARHAVVLACGGFVADDARRAATYPAPAGQPHRTPANPGNTGDGIRMAEAAGGAFKGDVMHPAAWMPVSVIPGRSGQEGVWPHLVDRQKPGFIAVLDNGNRFVDESASYHDFVPALIKACKGKEAATAWLIGDQLAVKRFGIGVVRPFPIPHRAHLRSGYLKKAGTLHELAEKIGINAKALENTVSEFNRDAAAGKDPQFGRGGRTYDIYQGDEENKPNPCLRALDYAPFYAIRIHASEICTFAGLKTDRCARVLGADGRPVPSLYAVGNDQANVFGGAYPGAGATLGPAMTFAYVAARHIAESASMLGSTAQEVQPVARAGNSTLQMSATPGNTRHG
jgi:succinate dehydrogenase/fumarate reductase flavoprotein subunit